MLELNIMDIKAIFCRLIDARLSFSPFLLIISLVLDFVKHSFMSNITLIFSICSCHYFEKFSASSCLQKKKTIVIALIGSTSILNESLAMNSSIGGLHDVSDI